MRMRVLYICGAVFLLSGCSMIATGPGQAANAAACPSVNDYKIVPGYRMGNVCLGMSIKDLYKTMGEPRQTYTGKDKAWYFYGVNDTLNAHVTDGVVDEIYTASVFYTADSGIRVGSSDIAVKAILGDPSSVPNRAKGDPTIRLDYVLHRGLPGAWWYLYERSDQGQITGIGVGYEP